MISAVLPQSAAAITRWTEIAAGNAFSFRTIAMTLGVGRHAVTPQEALAQAYDLHESDEFVLPTVIDSVFQPVSDGDSVILYNFRPDRAREITRAFAADNFDGFERAKKPHGLCYVCMTQYDAEMPHVEVAFPPENLTNTLGEYISDLGLTQLRIAETEKYAHVTFFFNGGIEAPNRNEDRILIPSPKVVTYDLKPEMSAYEITETVLAKSKKISMILSFLILPTQTSGRPYRCRESCRSGCGNTGCMHSAHYRTHFIKGRPDSANSRSRQC